MLKNDKSFYMIYRGNIVKGLEEKGINEYIILNNKLAAIYVNENFDEKILDEIKEIEWWSIDGHMSSLMKITSNIEKGDSAYSVAGVSYVDNNPYIDVTGKDVLIAVIDSGVDYLHPDLRDKDNKSKIFSLWDQENESGTVPKGLLFGSEFTKEQLNKAIEENNDTLSKDETGTGTMTAGILVGQGNINDEYKGIAKDAELVVVKLRSNKEIYHENRVSYRETDFLAAITYVTNIAQRERKALIVNLTVGSKSNIRVEASILETYSIFKRAGNIVVSGAGDEGNTDIHFSDSIKENIEYEDVLIQSGDNNNLDIILSGTGPDKIGIQIISPSGDISQRVEYSPDDQIYEGRFSIEQTDYRIIYRFPWLETGEESLNIALFDIKPGVWTLRLIPEFIVNGDYDIYLPNKNLISEDTRFLDSSSIGTITKFSLSREVITIGAYNTQTDSLWIGSSKGSVSGNRVNPDIVASGVDVISTYKNGEYETATGTGVSSSVVSGSLALIMQYLREESGLPKLSLFSDSLRAYLALGAIRSEIYTYPNTSQGYGVFNLENTFVQIARNL